VADALPVNDEEGYLMSDPMRVRMRVAAMDAPLRSCGFHGARWVKVDKLVEESLIPTG
jgi:hypothetical protein